MSTDKIFYHRSVFSVGETEKSKRSSLRSDRTHLRCILLLSETLRASRFCLLSNVNGITCHRQNFPFDVEE